MIKLVLTTLAVAFGSAVLPFINIEAYLGAVGGVQLANGGILAVSGAAAVGQTGGKLVLFYAADWAMNLPWIRKKMAKPKWQESYERWKVRIAERPGQTTLLLLASSCLGFPPLLVIAVLAGHLKVNVWLFTATCLIGRWVRFLVLLGAADWIVRQF